MAELKPFIKCPGGKRRMINTLIANLPPDFKQQEYSYVEAFIGGGSLLLKLISECPELSERAHINDFSADVFNLWNQVKYNSAGLIETLKSLDAPSKETFEAVKALFNSKGTKDATLRAAYFMFLNKTAFNGLIRYNSRGEYNAPFGRYDNPTIFNEENITNVGLALKNVSIVHGDFQPFIEGLLDSGSLRKNGFVYFDPPYIPISLTSSFCSYTYKGFGSYDHHRLKSLCDYLDKVGVKFMVSNSETPLTRELYGHFNVREVSNSRSISCKSASRGRISELLITNY